MIYAMTSESFAKHIHHKAYGEYERKAFERLGASREDVVAGGVAQYLGVEDDIAPRSLLTVENGVGTINVRGIMLQTPDPLFAFWEVAQVSYRDLATSLDEAKNDSNVESVAIQVDTPGGAVAGLEAIAAQLRDMGKPTTAIVEGMAASAGYWLASQADEITTTGATSVVGSIGVVVDTMDFSGWEESIGVKSLSITNRESEDKRPDLSTEHGVSVLQDELDELYEVFRDAVVSGRTGKNDFNPENVSGLAGRVVASKKALALGLIDNITLFKQEAGTMSGKDETVDATVTTPDATQAEPVTVPAAVVSEPVTIDATTNERERIMGILAIGGVQLSAELKGAIESNGTRESLAVAMIEAQNAKPEATMEIPAIPSAHKKEESKTAAMTDEEQEKKFSAMLDTVAPKANK